MDKLLTASEYGICLFSFNVLQDFLKKEKIRSKKLLNLFQKKKEIYLTTQKEGIWVPIPQINHYEYVIRVGRYDEPFDDEWEQKIAYEGFNLELKDGLWISGMGSFLTFQPEEYCGEEGFYNHKTPYGDIPHYFSKNERHYKTLDGYTIYTDFKYDIPDGKYLLSVKGYARKQRLESSVGQCGFFFTLTEVDTFDGYKDPREDSYNFNVGSIK